MAELLKGVKLTNSDGEHVAAEDALKGKVVGLYFSAGWCPPCRQFTPKLKRFYEALKKVAGTNFEVVFVSRDRAAEDLVEYFDDHHGQWFYLEFGNEWIAKLLEDYGVKTIPALRVIRPDGTVVVEDARTEVQEKGAEDPEKLWNEWLEKFKGMDFPTDI